MSKPSDFVMPTRRVEIEWVDASSVMSSNGTWKSYKKLKKEAKPAIIVSMGFVFEEGTAHGKEYIVLTSQLCPEDGVNDGNVTILKENIKRIEELVPAPKVDAA